MEDIITRLAAQALAAPLRFAPSVLQQGVLEQALNAVLRCPVAWGDLDFLEGRSIALEVVDLGWHWPITLEQGRVRVLRRSSPGDAIIRGRAHAFALLAGGLADPDTLFFQRRLAVEGDAELGLALKNFLDSVDFADLLPPCIAGIANAIHSRLSARPRNGETHAGSGA